MTEQTGQPKKASRRDVAELAGVAPSTVSLVLNGRAGEVRLSAETTARIEAAARRLNYVPNAAARSLGRRSSRTIGLLLNTPPTGTQTPIFADVTLSAVQQCKQLGYFVTVLPTTVTSGTEELLAEIRDADIAGLVCDASGHAQQLGRACERAGFPVVWLSRIAPRPRPGSWRVHIDSEPGVAALADHLVDRGYADVLVLAGADQDDQRHRTVLDRFGPAARVVPVGGWLSEHGRSAMRAELASDRQPAAVYAGNDLIAAGAIQALDEYGLRVPADVAVAGFGDFHFAADLTPPLTTVRWPLATAAAMASQILVDILRGDSPKRKQTIRTDLIVRRST